MRKPAAPASEVKAAPPDSCLQRTAPYLDEAAALDSVNLDTFNVVEVDRRLSLLSRFILEKVLREGRLPNKDMADLALRTINTLEGSKVRSELWVRDDEAPIPIDVEAYENELVKVEGEIRALAEKREGKKVADKALEAMGEDNGQQEVN